MLRGPRRRFLKRPGRIVVEAQKKYGVVIQHGTQRRSDEKIAVLQERAAAGLALFHPEDPTIEPLTDGDCRPARRAYFRGKR